MVERSDLAAVRGNLAAGGRRREVEGRVEAPPLRRRGHEAGPGHEARDLRRRRSEARRARAHRRARRVRRVAEEGARPDFLVRLPRPPRAPPLAMLQIVVIFV